MKHYCAQHRFYLAYKFGLNYMFGNAVALYDGKRSFCNICNSGNKYCTHIA